MPPLASHPALLRALADIVRSSGVSPRERTKALGDLFRTFTLERWRLPRDRYMDDPRLRLAYLTYHLPLNVSRATCVLRDVLRLRPEIAEVASVVDIGAGPASASLATLFGLPPSVARSYLLTDRSRRILREGKALMERCAEDIAAATPGIRCLVQSLPRLPEIPPGSLVWLSTVLNEAVPERRETGVLRRLAGDLERAVPVGSTVAIVETGLRRSGVLLLGLHEALVASPGWRIVAPCTHQMSCPLVGARGRPWCHFHLDWEPGPAARSVAAPLGLADRHASVSYLVAERIDTSGEAHSGPGQRHDEARVIGDRMDTGRGGTAIYVCRGGRRETLRSPPESLRRGDRVRLEGGAACEVRGGRWPG